MKIYKKIKNLKVCICLHACACICDETMQQYL
jgi:hypothetical protein